MRCRQIGTTAAIRRLPLLLAMLSLATADARADIYAFTDEGGTPHFSDVRSDPRYRLYLRVNQAGAGSDALSATAAAGDRAAIAKEIRRAAALYRLDEGLLHAVIAAESDYLPRSVSRKGAMGLMQLMPETARRFKVTDSFDPAQNIDAGAHYLSNLLAQFDNNLQLALAAYNAGEDNVRKYGGHIPPFPETLAYVPKVMDLYRKNMHRQR